tara:strand:+ start:1809 stop:2273 length:465 start_codon:yes stop_codon:yes gene_type:complete
MKKTNIKNFKKTLSKFTTGVTVVCVKNNKKIYGKTVNSFNSLSLNPPLVLFSLGNYSSSIKTYINSNYLTINILSKRQKKISNLFSMKNPNINDIKFLDGKNNTSFINGCIANLECKVVDRIKKGDHVIFICKVINVHYDDKIKPLTYYNSKYN